MNFDVKAMNWDTEERVSRAKIISEEIEKSIKINNLYNALEFGCGTGLISFNLYDKFNTLTLVDTSKGMIDKLNSKIQEFNIKNMKGYNVDIENPDVKLGEYDVIYTSMVLHHILNYEKTLIKLAQLLNKEGYLCIVDLNKEDGSFHSNDTEYSGHNGFEPQMLKAFLEENGFGNIHCKTIFKGEKTLENKKVEYSLFLLIAQK